MYIGVDLGGSFTKAGLVSNGELVKKFQVPTKKGGLDSVFEVVDELFNAGVRGIGVAIAGMVGEQRKVLSAANLKLENLDVAGILEAKYKVPVKVENDLACYALAENSSPLRKRGGRAADGVFDLVYLALGTGVNIGVIKNGVLLSGLEYGHTFFKGDDLCSCGLRGCVELFISGKALKQRVERLPEEFISNLSIVLLNIANSYRPKKIFIGGGLAAMVEPHLGKLNDNLKRNNYGYKNAPVVMVEISRLSTDGAILGAAGLFK